VRTQSINLTGTKVRKFLEIRKFLDEKKSLESDYFQGSFYDAFERVFCVSNAVFPLIKCFSNHISFLVEKNTFRF